MIKIAQECLRDYGVPATVAGVRKWAHITRPTIRKITSPAQYVAACRAIGRWREYLTPEKVYRPLSGKERIDGRLVAIGWNYEPPTKWLHDGGLQRFLRYWWASAKRPGVVGSSHNPYPEDSYLAMRLGIPKHVVRILPWWRIQRVVRTRDGKPLKRPLPRRKIRRLINAARAAGRTSIRSEELSRFSTRALEALGRLCPELQRVAIESLRNDPIWNKDGLIRVRDIPWAEVARVQSQITADKSGRVRATWATGRRQWVLFREATGTTEADGSKLIKWLTPSWPKVSLKQAVRLARSESPVSLSGGILTRQEAHEWLSDDPSMEPFEWLQIKWLPEATPQLRSLAITRWLLDVHRRGAWNALTKVREIVGPGGQRVHVKFLDRVDEIQDEDLDRGVRTGVDRAFENASRRIGGAWLERALRNHRVLRDIPQGWKLYNKSMRHLNTPAALAQEGVEMGHCVGGYTPAVEQGQSVILSINVLGNRSTVELRPNGQVLQHRGPHNTAPHPLCERVLERFLKRRIRR